ncbi:hypothetical protein [Bacillus toyonensis]|uniref:hypothetical protein n=1 Tax=Bacillus toyonensis TaxID=155322 RepID=UPI0015D4E82F|nr:hypothetical protein [Bacillus toyonensis]MBF7150004.1 hypothetical protein [Bacillus toyonensis]MEC2348041.1 hypothetical protein [Bacillus toyonensis]MED3188691.1 hypothetical protein [Bacillus toyonensis]
MYLIPFASNLDAFLISSGLLRPIFEIVFLVALFITMPMLTTLIATYYYSLRK